MATTVSRRPFGVSLLSILVIIAGVLDVLAGLEGLPVQGVLATAGRAAPQLPANFVATDYVAGEVMAAQARFVVRNGDLLLELKGSRGEITAFGTGLIILGVIAIVVGVMLWRGSDFARILIGIIALVRLIGTIWAFASFDRAHWYEGVGSVVIYAVVAGYLLFGTTARDYTTST